MTKTDKPCCPKCGGISGHFHRLTETHTMSGAWGDPAEANDSGLDVQRSLVECGDCGAKFQHDALARKGLV